MLSAAKSENPRKLETNDPFILSSNEKVVIGDEPLRMQEFATNSHKLTEASPQKVSS